MDFLLKCFLLFCFFLLQPKEYFQFCAVFVLQWSNCNRTIKQSNNQVHWTCHPSSGAWTQLQFTTYTGWYIMPMITGTQLKMKVVVSQIWEPWIVKKDQVCKRTQKFPKNLQRVASETTGDKSFNLFFRNLIFFTVQYLYSICVATFQQLHESVACLARTTCIQHKEMSIQHTLFATDFLNNSLNLFPQTTSLHAIGLATHFDPRPPPPPI